MNPTARIEKIALHRYQLQPKRLSAAAAITSGADAPARRYMLDPGGYDTRIVRSPDMEVLLRAYVTRRVVCAGRLLMLFAHLRNGLADQPVPGLPPAGQWAVEPCGAVVQLTPSVGGAGYTQACHTAPTQLTLAGHFPWTLARSSALKQEFLTWFGDIYVMPDTVNQTDSLIEREGDAGLANRRLFADAVHEVLRGGQPMDVLEATMGVLSARIAASPEYLCNGPNRDWVLGVYLTALPPGVALAQRALANYGVELGGF
jgi:hypothetical protein